MQNKIIGIFGKRGTGKTLLIKNLMLKMDLPIFIIDETGTFNLNGVKYYNDKVNILYKYTVFNEDNFYIALDYLKKIKKGTLIIDDGDYLLSLRELERALIYSRNYNYNVIYAVKRLIGISKRIINNTDIFYFFRVVEQKEIKKIYDSLGIYLPMLVNLPIRHYIKYHA